MDGASAARSSLIEYWWHMLTDWRGFILDFSPAGAPPPCPINGIRPSILEGANVHFWLHTLTSILHCSAACLRSLIAWPSLFFCLTLWTNKKRKWTFLLVPINRHAIWSPYHHRRGIDIDLAVKYNTCLNLNLISFLLFLCHSMLTARSEQRKSSLYDRCFTNTTCL